MLDILSEKVPSSALEKSEPEVVYHGTTLYYFRHAGIEEGAHAAFFNKKGNIQNLEPGFETNVIPKLKGQREVEAAIKSVKKINEERQNKVSGKFATCNTTVGELKEEDIAGIFEFLNANGYGFSGNTGNAVKYSKSFIEGVLLPLRIVFGQKLPPVKFGLYIPAKKGGYNFHYDAVHNHILINSHYLEEASRHNPLTSYTTAMVDNSGYSEQRHEQRALLWLIKDAKTQGYNDLAEKLRKQLKIVN